MNFTDAIAAGYKNYFKFRGRATRSAYWWFTLWNVVVALGMVALLVVGALEMKTNLALAAIALILGLVATLLVLATIIPAISLKVRRLHDAGQSGWWVGGEYALNALVQFVRIATHGSHDVGTVAVKFCVDIVFVIYGLIVLFFLVQPSKDTDRYESTMRDTIRYNDRYR